MSSPNVLNEVDKAFAALESFVKTNESRWNYSPAPERWTMGQHAEHLWLSGLGIASLYKQGDEFFKPFVPAQSAKSYEELEHQYFTLISKGAKAKAKQTPPDDFSKSPEIFIQDWKALQEKTKQRISDHWTEERLDNSHAPHPALGSISMREFIYFMGFHVQHHIRTLTKEYL